jgi:hypothetical protein
VYRMMDRVEGILGFADRVVGYATELERIPMMLIQKFMSK